MLYNNYISKIRLFLSIGNKRCTPSLVNFNIRNSFKPLVHQLLLIVFVFFANQVFAQFPNPANYIDSVPNIGNTMDLLSIEADMVIDSAYIAANQPRATDYPNARKAAFLGMIIPGAGHIYNGKYWKAPVIWGAFAGGVYMIQFNTSRHKLMKDAYCAKLVVENVRDSKINPCPPISAATSRQEDTYSNLIEKDSRFDSAAIKRFRDSFDKNTQLSWIGLIGGHLVLNGVWSYVDAHLNDFDMDEDLSLKLRPSVEIIALTNSSFVGMSVVLEF